jgi:transmembrane sensor
MTDPHREELILRYITGKLPSDVALRARTYLDETPRGHVVGIGLRQVMAAEILEDGAPDARTSLARLLDRLNREIPHFPSTLADGVGPGRPAVELPQSAGTVRTEVRGRKQAMLGPQTLRRGTWSQRTWTTAAALILVVIVLVFGWSTGVPGINQHAAMSSLTYTTGNGQRATITLPDSSTVMLDVASRLDVPLDYMAGHRTVRLVGEGLFTVHRHVGTPFTVAAGATTTRVLGTSFVVRRYATDTTALIAVREGKVAVGSTVVTANRFVTVGRAGVSHLRASDASLYTFATGILTIDDLPLPAAIMELDRWYDVDLRLGSPTLATQFVQGKFAAGSPGDLAAILEWTFDVRVVRDGRVLTLYPRH